MTTFEIDNLEEIEWSPLLDAIEDLVSVHKIDGTILRVNKAFAEFFDKSAEELIGKECFCLFHGTTECIEECPMQKMNNTGCCSSSVLDHDVGDRVFEVSASPVKDLEGEIIACIHVVRDITERREMAIANEKREKLNAIVEMAGGISHDINQPLTVFAGYVDLIRRKLPADDEKVHTYIEKMKGEIEHLKEISKNLNHITRYKTMDYPGDGRIVDIKGSSSE
ncbi:MAG: PAS domain-containing protein [Planctomycetota bacterium]|jgi:PAS domain S-box-containing protein